MNSGTLNFKHALILEDEVHLGDALALALKQLKIKSLLVRTLEEARQAWQNENDFDLVLLDRILPDGDGIDFCVELRSSAWQGAILVLSASGNVDARVEGLNAGADDYIPKPFSWEELSARITALSRRSKSPSPETWQIAADTLTIHSPNGSVSLTPLEFRLAQYLIEASPRIVDRAELLEKVWGQRALTNTRTVDLFIGRLRKYFEKDPEKPVHFLTVRGAGYQFKT